MIQPPTEISFAANKWKDVLNEQIILYGFLLRMLSSQDVVTVMVNESSIDSRKLPDSELQEIINLLASYLSKDAKAEIAQEEVAKGLVGVLLLFSKNVIVVAVTYLEGMIEDFAVSLFCKYPERMYDYLSPEVEKIDGLSSRGKLDLNEVLNVDSKADLIYNLACKSSTNLSRGDIKSVVKRLNKITKDNIDEELLKDLIATFDLRHKIVHKMRGAQDIPIQIEDVNIALKCIERLIAHFVKLADKMDISVEQSVVVT